MINTAELSPLHIYIAALAAQIKPIRVWEDSLPDQDSSVTRDGIAVVVEHVTEASSAQPLNGDAGRIVFHVKVYERATGNEMVGISEVFERVAIKALSENITGNKNVRIQVSRHSAHIAPFTGRELRGVVGTYSIDFNTIKRSSYNV